APLHHLYEAVFYVLSGRGSTSIETAAGEHAFEWGQRSLFAIPLNSRYRLFNGSGKEPARFACTANLPAVMKMFHDEAFVFGDAWGFAERAGKSKYFDGKGDLVSIRPGNHLWETNFVPDLRSIE